MTFGASVRRGMPLRTQSCLLRGTLAAVADRVAADATDAGADQRAPAGIARQRPDRRTAQRADGRPPWRCRAASRSCPRNRRGLRRAAARRRSGTASSSIMAFSFRSTAARCGRRRGAGIGGGGEAQHALGGAGARILLVGRGPGDEFRRRPGRASAPAPAGRRSAAGPAGRRCSRAWVCPTVDQRGEAGRAQRHGVGVVGGRAAETGEVGRGEGGRGAAGGLPLGERGRCGDARRRVRGQHCPAASSG